MFAMSIAALAFGARWLWRWDVAATKLVVLFGLAVLTLLIRSATHGVRRLRSTDRALPPR
ncbi:MAG: hypothetical protein ABSH51_23740 [Solirubrobacteraceae bacterium]